MKHLRPYTALAFTFAVLLAAGSGTNAQPMPTHLPTPAPSTLMTGAHGRYGKARIYLGVANLALTRAVIDAGGGVGGFDSQRLVATLTGNGPLVQTEVAGLTKKFGAAALEIFRKTSNFVVADSLAQPPIFGFALPPAPVPDAQDGPALAAALYVAGMTPRGGFDVEILLDHLFSHVLHVQLMNDIDGAATLGPQDDATYHAVFSQLIVDLKAATKS